MNTKQVNQQIDDKLDAILHTVAPAAEPDIAKMQRQIRSRMTHAMTHTHQIEKPAQFYWKLSYGIAAVLVVFTVWFTFNQFNEVLPTAIMVYTDGSGVSIEHGEEVFSPVMQNDELQTGSVIETDANSKATFILSDFSTIRLNSSSKLRIESNHELVLESGTLYAEVTKRIPGQERFKIFAGDVEVQVLGTAFEVVHQNDEVTVSVTEGVVRVAASENSVQSVKKDYAVAYKKNVLNTPAKINPALIAPWKNAMNDSEFVKLMKDLLPSRSMR